MNIYNIGGVSKEGSKTKSNQDACFAGITHSGIGEVAFAVICDGMGGMQCGEMASATIVEEACKWFYRQCDKELSWMPDVFSIHTEWEEILDYCNELLMKHGRENGLKIGSTVVFILITPQNVLTMNVGDSRAYVLGEGCRRITVDDSLVGHEIRLGLLTEEEAKKDKRNNQLTQCIGINDDISPHFLNEDVQKAVYLLATDGFYNCLSNDEIVEAIVSLEIKNDENLTDMLEKLAERGRTRGERDDITAIAIAVQ